MGANLKINKIMIKKKNTRLVSSYLIKSCKNKIIYLGKTHIINFSLKSRKKIRSFIVAEIIENKQNLEHARSLKYEKIIHRILCRIKGNNINKNSTIFRKNNLRVSLIRQLLKKKRLDNNLNKNKLRYYYRMVTGKKIRKLRTIRKSLKKLKIEQEKISIAKGKCSVYCLVK